MYDLKKKAFLGMLWSSGNYVFTQIVLLIAKLVLVRFLIPEEFGLAAMAYIVVSSLSLINAFGTGTAYIRDNKSDQHKAKNTLFYLDFVAISLVALLSFLMAPFATSFFSINISDPASINTLLWMFRVVAICQLFSILVIVPSRQLTKELKFKQSSIASLAGITVYGILAIVLSILGFGAWSIIIAQLANLFVSKLIIFFYSPFFPSWIFDWKIAKKYLIFGKNAFINSIIGVVITNGDDTLVGRIVGSAALGFYSLGQHFAGLVVSIVSGIIGGVMFPVFSQLQKNKKIYVKAFFKAYRLKNIFALPSIGGSIVLANWIVLLIFGENWLPILPVFYVLSVASLLNHFVSLAAPVLNSLNKPEVIKNNRLIQFCFYLVLIYPFVRYWGILGVSYVMVIFAFVSLLHYAPHLAKIIPNFYSTAIKIMSKSILGTLIMMFLVNYLKINMVMNFISMGVLVVVGVLIYFGIMWFLDKELRWDLQEALTVFPWLKKKV